MNLYQFLGSLCFLEMNMVTTIPHVEAMVEVTHTVARTGRTTGTEARRTVPRSTAGNPSRGQDNTEVGGMTAGVRDTITGDRKGQMEILLGF